MFVSFSFDFQENPRELSNLIFPGDTFPFQKAISLVSQMKKESFLININPVYTSIPDIVNLLAATAQMKGL